MTSHGTDISTTKFVVIANLLSYAREIEYHRIFPRLDYVIEMQQGHVKHTEGDEVTQLPSVNYVSSL